MGMIDSWLARLTVVQMGIAMLAALGSMQYNVALFALGFWAIYSDHQNALQLYLIVISFSILTDIVWLGVYGEDIINGDTYPDEAQQLGFSMDIINLILKPVTIFLCYRSIRGN